ncbi:MAG: hypothetical protein PHY08_14130 [Candidatus Cloacimonetes bacterium]|nr:hypothetical protein [Candidatus Cloacimonadota bacterium]
MTISLRNEHEKDYRAIDIKINDGNLDWLNKIILKLAKSIESSRKRFEEF